MAAIFQGMGANTALSSTNSNKFCLSSHGSVSGVVSNALVCSFLLVFSSVFKNLNALFIGFATTCVTFVDIILTKILCHLLVLFTYLVFFLPNSWWNSRRLLKWVFLTQLKFEDNSSDLFLNILENSLYLGKMFRP